VAFRLRYSPECVEGMFVRLQSTQGEERWQIKWFAYAAAVLLSAFFLGLPLAAVIGAMGEHGQH
jgi:hypothetical protein